MFVFPEIPAWVVLLVLLFGMLLYSLPAILIVLVARYAGRAFVPRYVLGRRIVDWPVIGVVVTTVAVTIPVGLVFWANGWFDVVELTTWPAFYAVVLLLLAPILILTTRPTPSWDR
jgi:hypothetical protein